MTATTFDAVTAVTYRTSETGEVIVERRTTFTSTDAAFPGIVWEHRETRTIEPTADTKGETAELRAIAAAVRTPARLAEDARRKAPPPEGMARG